MKKTWFWTLAPRRSTGPSTISSQPSSSSKATSTASWQAFTQRLLNGTRICRSLGGVEKMHRYSAEGGSLSF
ncbi:unnamed protein product [Symbiodinium necroappetens]|uniref:Uncharacterized protein n=1 Tax=Symbiodinium necroappetens TaxID=1628268 RepID=A0A813ADK0_9DINO|nr:unnamed protein product [Symbiodinium necroappetens]